MKLRRSVRTRVTQRIRRSSMHVMVLLVALAVALVMAPPAVAAPVAAPAAADDGVLRVALFWGDAHASQVQARVLIKQLATDLAAESGQTVQIQETNQASEVFTPANLAMVDTLVFTQNGGVLFNLEQRAALESYITGGGGFVGMHYTGWSAGQSEHDVNPFYARLVGAVSEGHPENIAVRPGRVFVKDSAHPLTQGLPSEITRSDEWYDWVVNPAPNVRTLLEADEMSYQIQGRQEGRQGTTHPITWCQDGNEDNGLGQGRSWFTGMGHSSADYSEAFIRNQLKNGMAYAAGLRPTADCSPPAKDEQGTWDRPSAPTENPATDPVGDNPAQNGVTPWPLVPINAALTSDGKVDRKSHV